MANNKKNKAAKAKKENEAKPVAAAAPTAPVTPSADNNMPPKGLGQFQFTGIMFLIVGAMYLKEFNTVLQANNCASYLVNFNGDCTATDQAMMLTKFHSGVLVELLVALIMLLVWNNAPLFARFNGILCSSPLITTLLAMQTTKDIVHPRPLLKLCLLVTILLALFASSVYFATHSIALRTRWTIDLPNATLLTVAIAHMWEIYKFLSAGVYGVLAAPTGDEFDANTSAGTPPSIALLPYLAVDQATMVGVCMFAAVYLGEVQKRTALLWIAVVQAIGLYYQLPQREGMLLDPTYYENFYKGTAMFSLTACLAPDVVLFTEPEELFNASRAVEEPQADIATAGAKED